MKKLVLVLLCGWAVGADSPVQVSELSKQKLLSAYKSAVIATVEVQMAQARAEQFRQAFNQLVQEVKKDEKLPNGADITVAIAPDQVTVTLPKKEASPEKK